MVLCFPMPCKFMSARAEPTSSNLSVPVHGPRGLGNMSGVEEIGEEDGYTHHDRLLRESRQMNFVRTTILTEFITITTTSRPPSPPSSPPSQPASDLKPPDVDEEVSSVPIEPTSIPSHNPSQNPEPEAGGEDPLPSLTDSIIFPTATSALDPDTGAMDDSPYVVHSFPPTAGINAVPSRPPGDRRPNQVFATLLTGNCSSAKFTLLDGGPTLYYVPFVGCNNDKPGCCPFTPRTIDPIEPAKAVITFSPSITGAPDQLYAYPRPTNTNDATLDSCASDYYSVSGSCCPNGYTPWTAALGGETPCASPLTSSTRAPPITASRDPAAATKPTIVATGLVFAMQYAVQGESDQGLSLSAGAIAGIVIGSICGVLAIVGLSFFIRRRQKQSRQLVGLKKELHSNFYGTTAGTSEVPTAGRSPAPTSVRGDQSSDWARTTLRDSTAFAKEQNGGGDSGGESSSPAELYGGSSPVAMYSPDPGLFPPRRPVGSPPRPRKGQQSPLTSPINPSEIFDWPSVTSSPALPSMQVGSELQLAKPQRLSRGYAKVVYQGRGSTTSVPSDLGDHGGPGSAGRPATASSSKTSATRPMTGRMPGTPELDERPRDREM